MSCDHHTAREVAMNFLFIQSLCIQIINSFNLVASKLTRFYCIATQPIVFINESLDYLLQIYKDLFAHICACEVGRFLLMHNTACKIFLKLLGSANQSASSSLLSRQCGCDKFANGRWHSTTWNVPAKLICVLAVQIGLSSRVQESTKLHNAAVLLRSRDT